MSVAITQTAVHSASGAPRAGEELTASVELSNAGDQFAHVDVTITIDAQPAGTVTVEVPPAGSQWAQVTLAQLAPGGHDLAVTCAVDDGVSNAEAQGGTSFQVEAAPVPTAHIGELHFQPHSNVEHPAGQAWTGERITVSAPITNTSTSHLQATAWVTDETGAGGQHQVSLAPNESQWVQQDFEPLPAGPHTFTAQASTETDGQSVLLGHAQGTLTITATATGYHHVNVQLTLHSFRNQPLVGRSVFVQFMGMDGTVADGAETLQGTVTSGGTLTLPNVLVPPRGTMRVMAVSNGQPDEPIDSSVRYHMADNQTDLGYTCVQEHVDETVKARSLSAVRDKLSAEGHAGLEIEVLSIGGSVATESEQSHQYETEVDWTVRVGRPSFAFTSD